MLKAFLFSSRLFFSLWWQSLRRHSDIGRLSFRGRCLRLLLWALSLPLWLLHWCGLALDEILFRGYRRVRIRQPVFILGVPRSGTTFLHRTLAADTARFSTLPTWEALLAPSITQRKFWGLLAGLDRLIGGPFARLVRLLERKLFSALEGVHDVSLDAAEEDYLLLLPLLSCFILFLPFPESGHIWRMARFDWEASPRERDIVMSFYRAMLRKHVYVHGQDRVYLSKNAAFASWPRSILASFPDARFVICMREPHRALPSLLGSLKEGAEFFELDLERGELPLRLSEMMRDYYRYLLTDFPVKAPIVHMDELKRNLVASVEGVYAELGEELSDSYRAKLLELSKEAETFQTQTQAIQPASDHAFYEHQFPWYYELPRRSGAVSPAGEEQNRS